MHFVFSAPRSGSTWLARCLGRHPQVFATEHRLFGGFAEVWPDGTGRTSLRVTADALAEAAAMHYLFQPWGWTRRDFVQRFTGEYAAFLESFGQRHSGKPLVVDKITPYLGTAPRVLASIDHFFPEARVIQLVRDGRDVAVSGVFDWVRREPPDSPRYRFFVHQVPEMSFPRFFDDQVLATWCRYWNEPLEAVRDWSADPRHAARVLAITYEQMLADAAGTLQRVFSFLNVAAPPELCQEIAEAESFRHTTGRAPGDANPLAKARIGVRGDWRRWFTRQDGARFAEQCAPWLKRWGYEPDDRWIETLAVRLEWPVP